MAKKKTITPEEKILEEKFEEILESVDAGKVPVEASEYVVNACLDSNRALKLEICDKIEKINNRYYLLIIKKYIDNLGG